MLQLCNFECNNNYNNRKVLESSVTPVEMPELENSIRFFVINFLKLIFGILV